MVKIWQEALLTGNGPQITTVAKLFNFCRYAIQSSTQVSPAALTCAIPINSPDLLLPLFDLLDHRLDEFRDNAQKIYGYQGILVPIPYSHPHQHDCVGSVPNPTPEIFGAAQMSRLYDQYWRATGDRDFLAHRAWPFLSEAAAFYENFLSEDIISTDMDLAPIHDLFINLIQYKDIIHFNQEKIDRWNNILLFLSSHQEKIDNSITEHVIEQQLMRWKDTWAETDYVSKMTYDLIEIGLSATRLGMSNTAYEILMTLTEAFTRPILHPPCPPCPRINTINTINTEACGGFIALVIAMVVNTQDDRIEVLPAVPDIWPQGEIRGIAGCGRITITRLSWAPEKVEIYLLCPVERSVTVLISGTSIPLALRPNRPIGVIATRRTASRTSATP